jgi:hypothetical protein
VGRVAAQMDPRLVSLCTICYRLRSETRTVLWQHLDGRPVYSHMTLRGHKSFRRCPYARTQQIVVHSATATKNCTRYNTTAGMRNRVSHLLACDSSQITHHSLQSFCGRSSDRYMCVCVVVHSLWMSLMSVLARALLRTCVTQSQLRTDTGRTACGSE